MAFSDHDEPRDHLETIRARFIGQRVLADADTSSLQGLRSDAVNPARNCSLRTLVAAGRSGEGDGLDGRAPVRGGDGLSQPRCPSFGSIATARIQPLLSAFPEGRISARRTVWSLRKVVPHCAENGCENSSLPREEKSPRPERRERHTGIRLTALSLVNARSPGFAPLPCFCGRP